MSRLPFSGGPGFLRKKARKRAEKLFKNPAGPKTNAYPKAGTNYGKQIAKASKGLDIYTAGWNPGP